MVQDYQKEKRNKEASVLEVVKKNPLYSVDKLKDALPDFSRHSIQRILEKHNLSTIEKRLDYSSQQKQPASELKPEVSDKKDIVQEVIKEETREIKKDLDEILAPKEVKGIHRFLGRIKGPLSAFFVNSKKSFTKRALIKVFGLILVLFSLYNIGGIIFAKNPEIQLDQPSQGADNKGEKLFVSGKVSPSFSYVTVNQHKVALNGDGKFTAVVAIPVGESTLQIKARYLNREAQMIRLVKRVLTQEEIQAQKAEQEKKRKAMVDQQTELDRKVNDILAAKSAGGTPNLRIISSHIKDEEGFSNIEGTVINTSNDFLTSVLVTVKFIDQSGGVIDTKYGAVTEFGEKLEPGKQHDFLTQATSKPFTKYMIELGADVVPTITPVVAGASTEASASGNKTTPTISLTPTPTR